MGIDRIGKGGGPSGVMPPASSVTGVGAADTFEVAGPDAATEVAGAAPLDRLRSGELDMDGYLNARVDQATSHLEGRIDPERLEFIRATLRSQLQSDPALMDLVIRATGQAAKLERG